MPCTELQLTKTACSVTQLFTQQTAEERYCPGSCGPFWSELTGISSDALLCPIKIYVLDHSQVIYSLTWLSPAILSVFCYLTILSSSLDLHKTSASHQPPGPGTLCTSASKASPPPPSTSPGKRLHTSVLNSKVFLNRVQFLYFISLNTHSFVYASD